MTGVERIETEPLAECCYVVAAGGDAVIVDPGGEPERIRDRVRRRSLRVWAILCTHAHHDHIAAAAPLAAAYGAPFHLHPADERLLQRANFYHSFLGDRAPMQIPEVAARLADGQELRFGELALTVLHTPGHTPGSVCFETAAGLFTGDTLLPGELGRTDLPGGDRGALEGSVARLARGRASETRVYPGHGEPLSLGQALAGISLAETPR